MLGERILRHALLDDPAARQALFCSSHALARAVLLHAPGAKRLTHVLGGDAGGARRSATLAALLGARWQPLPLHALELCATAHAWARLPAGLLPAAIRKTVAHLHLQQFELTAAALSTWRLHNATLWPHLRTLTIRNCSYACPPAPNATAAFDDDKNDDDDDEEEEEERDAATPPLLPIPQLQALHWRVGYVRSPGEFDMVLRLAADVRQLRLSASAGSGGGYGGGGGDGGSAAARNDLHVLSRLRRLTHVHLEGGAAVEPAVLSALLSHPTLRHVTLQTVGALAVDGDAFARHPPCRWHSLTVLGGADVVVLGRLAAPLAGLRRLAVRGGLSAWSQTVPSRRRQMEAGVALLARLHGERALRVLPEAQEAELCKWQLTHGGDNGGGGGSAGSAGTGRAMFKVRSRRSRT